MFHVVAAPIYEDCIVAGYTTERKAKQYGRKIRKLRKQCQNCEQTFYETTIVSHLTLKQVVSPCCHQPFIIV